jgi:Ca2+-transporting ATPase
MGKKGTDVARETADLILVDDNFATVATAIKEGRKLFANLLKAVRFYLAAKVALISISLAASLAGLAIPFSPLQIITLELFMDLGASTSFTVEPAEADIMKNPPRSTQEKFLNKTMVGGIFSGGFSLGVSVFLAYILTLTQGSSVIHAQTVAFSTWMIGHLVLAMLMRSEREPLYSLGILTNKVILLWIGSAVAFLLLAINVPELGRLFYLTSLNVKDWALVLMCAFLVPAWLEIRKMVLWNRQGAASHTAQVLLDSLGEEVRKQTSEF